MRTELIFSACVLLATAGRALAEDDSFFDAFEPEHEVAQNGAVDAAPVPVAAVPRVYSSLPIRVSFEAETEEQSTLEQAPLAESVVEPHAVKRVNAGPCAAELRTAALSITTHERVGAKIYVKEGSLIPRATVAGTVGAGVYLSVGTDIDATLAGTPAQKAACLAALRKAPVALGKLSLATTKLTLLGSIEELPLLAIKPAAQAQAARLALDAAGNPVVLDARKLPLMLESGVYYLKSDIQASYELDVEPGIYLQN